MGLSFPNCKTRIIITLASQGYSVTVQSTTFLVQSLCLPLGVMRALSSERFLELSGVKLGWNPCPNPETRAVTLPCAFILGSSRSQPDS